MNGLVPHIAYYDREQGGEVIQALAFEAPLSLHRGNPAR